ncbi:MAG: hypothetical protein A3C11_03095 [Candidatus Sungbacteria bacterium RIFCSPHIGHO2_02_FULL_49_12]|uniref:Uncharacterized protein n=1 Tax=Candidatus Sungbacteria bacterium RIFCSPHIGHO2_02_FULL_49_12 TaxID=1802271 RepID=A0A1G2KQJ9_9BACT|nr:MAG: hypothetical protein A3C11_03095 [Candidatus Sungbacteria bacterium RIFCSPHIGHO2_02_FULL_49_12]
MAETPMGADNHETLVEPDKAVQPVDWDLMYGPGTPDQFAGRSMVLLLLLGLVSFITLAFGGMVSFLLERLRPRAG